MKKLIIFFSLLHFYNVYAQSTDNNHRKYWYYRSRLTNDFMKIGPNQGESLILSHRAYLSSGSAAPSVEFGTDEVGGMLAQYISVLATEYKLLVANSQATDSTLRELYYALEAFNRLDYNAEAVYGYPPALNGFFIRQDVPCDFIIDNLSHFNYELNTLGKAVVVNNDKIHYSIGSDAYTIWDAVQPTYSGFSSNTYSVRTIEKENQTLFCRYQNNPGDLIAQVNLAMSLDQCISMFTACALINKFIPSGTTYNNLPFKDNLTDIRDEARAISSRMLNTLKGDGDWRIKLPDGTLISKINPTNDYGGNAFAYGWPFSEADCKIHKQNTDLNSVLPCIGSQNIISGTAGFLTWNGLTSVAGIPFDIAHPDNAQKTVMLSAACNCDYAMSTTGYAANVVVGAYDYIVGWIHHWSSGTPAPSYPVQTLVDNITETRIENRSSNFNLQYGPLLRKVLHGGQNYSYSGFDYEGFLNSAPCSGPYYLKDFPMPTWYPLRWESIDNLDHPGNNYVPYSESGQAGEYPGLDYMLYHNLYYIDQGGAGAASVFDYRFRVLPSGSDFPYSYLGTLQGSNAFPIFIRAFENLTASNNINASNPSVPSDAANGNVNYESGKQVHLQTGFHASSGAYFHAFIQKPFCGSYTLDNNQVYKLANQHSTANEDYFSPDNYNKPTMYVQYPRLVMDAEEQIIQAQANTKQVALNQETLVNGSVNIYPNPNNGNFYVESVLNEKETANVYVTDMLGNIVFKKENSTVDKLEININQLSQGLYMVKYVTNQNRSLIQKIIVQ